MSTFSEFFHSYLVPLIFLYFIILIESSWFSAVKQLNRFIIIIIIIIIIVVVVVVVNWGGTT
jgi:hypothetical protein